MRKPTAKTLVVVDKIERVVVQMRGRHVMLDSHLAPLYGVSVKALNQAVKRNSRRFPTDFMFRLTIRESESLRSQSVTSKSGRGRHRKYLACAFTEQGVAMLSSVLRSTRAVSVNIEIMRAFVRLRRNLDSHAELTRRLDQLEDHYDGRFTVVFQAIRKLMAPLLASCRRIGFRVPLAAKPAAPSAKRQHPSPKP